MATPSSQLIKRLRELSVAVAKGDRSELTMRVPADPERDADLVLSSAADEIERLRGVLWYAWRECNAIRARDGAPPGVHEPYFDALVERMYELLGDDAQPWPSESAKQIALVSDDE